jgi:hypothetical protein
MMTASPSFWLAVVSMFDSGVGFIAVILASYFNVLTFLDVTPSSAKETLRIL